VTFPIKSSFDHFSHLLISDIYVLHGALMLPKTVVSDFGASLGDYATFIDPNNNQDVLWILLFLFLLLKLRKLSCQPLHMKVFRSQVKSSHSIMMRVIFKYGGRRIWLDLMSLLDLWYNVFVWHCFFLGHFYYKI
jgi:hypothetical protein